MNVKKFGALIITLLLSLGMTTGCGGRQKETQSGQGALAKIKAAGEIKIGTEGVNAPMSYHDENKKLTGFDVEVAEAVAKKLGVKPVFIETKWDSMMAGLDAGRFDIVANQVAVTEERKKKFAFSVPYLYVYETIATRKDDNSIKTFDDLKGKKVAQVVSSNLGKTAEKHGGILVPVDDFKQSVDLVEAGRAEGTVNNNLIVPYYLKKKPNANLKVAVKAKNFVTCALPMKKENQDLLKAVNQALDELRKDGTLKKISLKYFGTDVTVE